jgi:hypothetical protein
MRTVSATISTAVEQDVTKPIFLIRMAWDTEVRSATWASNITWNAETWSASGIEVTGLDANGGTMDLPMGDGLPWLALVRDELPRGRAIEVYEHHTNFTVSPIVSDAVLIFAGFMDAASIGDSIRISLIASETKKGFPPGRIDRPTYNHLLPAGSRIQWGADIVLVN